MTKDELDSIGIRFDQLGEKLILLAQNTTDEVMIDADIVPLFWDIEDSIIGAEIEAEHLERMMKQVAKAHIKETI